VETGSKEEAQCPHSPQEEKGSMTEMIILKFYHPFSSILYGRLLGRPQKNHCQVSDLPF